MEIEFSVALILMASTLAILIAVRLVRGQSLQTV
jgi:hypothetical protein